MKRRVAGAGLLVAIGIGIWLSSLFKGLGPGGEGTGIGRSENVLVNVDGSEMPPDSHASGEPSTAALAAGSVPTVLIDGHQYLLQTGSGPTENFRPAELDEIVRMVQQAQPGEDGIRVHIKRRQSSRAAAENALSAALREAGIETSAVQEHRAFVE